MKVESLSILEQNIGLPQTQEQPTLVVSLLSQVEYSSVETSKPFLPNLYGGAQLNIFKKVLGGVT